MSNARNVRPGNKLPVGKAPDLGALTTDNSTVAEYPILTASAPVAKAAKDLKSFRTDIKSLEERAKTAIATLIAAGVPFFFKKNADEPTPSTGIAIMDDEDQRLALLLVKDSYPVLKPKKGQSLQDISNTVADIVGKTFFQTHFKEVMDVKIDIGQVPEKLQQKFVTDLAELLANYNAKKAVKVTTGVTVNDNFHVVRHTALTPKQNESLQEIFPATVAVETK